MATVLIPVPLRRLTNGVDTVFCEASTIKELIENLEFGYPGMKERLCASDDSINRFINIYVNGEDIRFGAGTDACISEKDEVSIVPAIAGG